MTLAERLASLALASLGASVTVLYLAGPWWALLALWVSMSVPAGVLAGSIFKGPSIQAQE